MMKRRSILSKDFLLIAAGQIISLFGNQILRYALPLYLLNQTGSAALFGTISACAFLPMLMIYPIGGIIADRVNKRNIMVILDFTTAAITTLFCLLKEQINMIPLMAVVLMILYGIQGIYQPAVNASIPVLVENESIVQANSVINVISSTANMTGSILGGILFSIVGLMPILYVSIGCFCASAFMELFIEIPYEKKTTKRNILRVGFGDLKESFWFIFREEPVVLRAALIYGFVTMCLCSLSVISVPVLITQYMGFSAGKANRLYGYAQGVIAAGSILGGVLAGVFSKRLKPVHIPAVIQGSAVSIFLAGTALQMLKTSIGIYIVLVLGCSFMLLLSSLFQIQMLSYVQILTPNQFIGKVVSCVICVCMCANPIGQFIYGTVFEKIGDNAYLIFYIAALLVIGISVFARKVFRDIGQHVSSMS